MNRTTNRFGRNRFAFGHGATFQTNLVWAFQLRGWRLSFCPTHIVDGTHFDTQFNVELFSQRSEDKSPLRIVHCLRTWEWTGPFKRAIAFQPLLSASMIAKHQNCVSFREGSHLQDQLQAKTRVVLDMARLELSKFWRRLWRKDMMSAQVALSHTQHARCPALVPLQRPRKRI